MIVVGLIMWYNVDFLLYCWLVDFGEYVNEQYIYMDVELTDIEQRLVGM